LDDDIIECKCSKIDEEEEDSDYPLCISLLLCLSYAYMELRHYHSAIDCLNECSTYSDDDNNCDIYFRKSQARMYNKKSTREELNLALIDAQKTLNIYNKNDKNSQIYTEHYQILKKFIEDKTNFEQERIKSKSIEIISSYRLLYRCFKLLYEKLSKCFYYKF
jgi:SOS response regulatory protein OraA/RecX